MNTCDDISEDEENSIDHSELTGSGSSISIEFVEDFVGIDCSFEGEYSFDEQKSESADMEDDDVAQSCDPTELSMKRKILEDERMEEIIASMDIKELIKYAYGGEEMYRCLLCDTFFDWKHIAHHYKTNHREVLIARLKPQTAISAICDAQNSKTAIPAVAKSLRRTDYGCRFCWHVMNDINIFYEHCTIHTGEYPYHRNGRSYITGDLFRDILLKEYSTYGTYSMDVVPEQEENVYGYLCWDCNYVQLKLQNVKLHAAFWHRNKTSTRILKIDMSRYSHNGIIDEPDVNEDESAPKYMFQIGGVVAC